MSWSTVKKSLSRRCIVSPGPCQDQAVPPYWMTKQGGDWSERPPRGHWQLWKSYMPSWQRLVTVTKRSLATLKELHAFMAKTGHCVHVTTISQARHKSGMYGGVARGKPLLKKAHLESHLRFAKKISPEILKPRGKKFCSLTKLRRNFLASIQNVTFVANPTQYITQRSPSLL